MRRGQAIDLLGRRKHHTIMANRADAGTVAAVRGGEQITALQIGGNMGWAAWQWCHPSLMQRAIVRDTVADNAKRRTYPNIQMSLVRVDRHRLYLPRDLDRLQQRQCALVV
ncbi:hypothetical protein D3C75_1129930 [compost metagenome]